VKGWGKMFESVYVLYGMLCQDGSRFGIFGVVAKEDFRKAEKETFVFSTASKVVPLPHFGSTM
jgi:hypothetical protein